MLKGLIRQLLNRTRADAGAPLAGAHACLQRGEYDAALAAFWQALKADPRLAAAWNGAGVCLRNLGRTDEAEDSFRAALRIDPALAEAQLNLGNFAYLRGEQDAAIGHFRAFLALDPGNLATQNVLGGLYADQGRFAEARACHRVVLDADPGYLQVYSIFLLLLNFDPDVTPAEVLAEHRRWDERCARPLLAQAVACDNDPDPERRLRIGYVSPYFVGQPVAYFVEPLLAAHDRAGFDLFLYSDAANPDEVTARLRAGADAFRETRTLDDSQLCAQVRADRIDILVDLTGHNAHNRLLAFARRPAPLQVTYLGPNSSGMSAMDYRVTDPMVDPPGAEAQSSERLLRLPGAQWAYRPPAQMPEVRPLPALARGHITFGSFNHAGKLNTPTLDTWAELLARVAGSRLHIVGVASRAHGERLLRAFQARGIAAERISLVAHPGYQRYWDLYHDVDIALDSFPFNGVTTTMGCLWMGLPVVSRSGPWIASRYGASLLGNLGAPQWVGADAAGFVDAVERLAADPGTLAQVRAGLRDRLRASSLLDGAALARKVEAAYRGIWRDWCTSRAHANMAGTVGNL
jgi:protein O-GlcNAc transferase